LPGAVSAPLLRDPCSTREAPHGLPRELEPRVPVVPLDALARLDAVADSPRVRETDIPHGASCGFVHEAHTAALHGCHAERVPARRNDVSGPDTLHGGPEGGVLGRLVVLPGGLTVSGEHS